jgi:hypothetical protein
MDGFYIRAFDGPFDFAPRTCRERAFPEDVQETASLYDLHHVNGVAFFRSESILDLSAGVFNYVSPPLATFWQAYRRMK